MEANAKAGASLGGQLAIGCKGCLFASESDFVKSLPILSHLRRELSGIVDADAARLDECSRFVQAFVRGAVEHTANLDNWTKFLIPWKQDLGGFIQPKLPPGVKVQLGPDPAPCDFVNFGNYPTKNCADKAPQCVDRNGVQCWGFGGIPYNLSDPGNRCVYEAQKQLPTKFCRNILRRYLNVQGHIPEASINTLFLDKSFFSAEPPPKKHASGPKRGKRLTPKENEEWLRRQWDQCLEMIGTTSSVELLLSVCLLTSHAISNKLRTGNPLLVQPFALWIERMLPIKNIKEPIVNDFFIIPARLPHMENNVTEGYFDNYSQKLINSYDQIITDTYMRTVPDILFSPEQIVRLREIDGVVATVYRHMAFGKKTPEELRQMNPVAETDYVKDGKVVVEAGEHYHTFGEYIHHTETGLYDKEKLPTAETDYIVRGVVVVKAGQQYHNLGQYNHHTGSGMCDKEKLPIAKTDYIVCGEVVVKAGEQYLNRGQYLHHTKSQQRAKEKRDEEREFMVAQTEKERIPLYCPDCDRTTDADGNPLMSKYKYYHKGSSNTSPGWKTVVERCNNNVHHERCTCFLKPVDKSIGKDAIITKDTMLSRERKKKKLQEQASSTHLSSTDNLESNDSTQSASSGNNKRKACDITPVLSIDSSVIAESVSLSSSSDESDRGIAMSSIPSSSSVEPFTRVEVEFEEGNYHGTIISVSPPYKNVGQTVTITFDDNDTYCGIECPSSDVRFLTNSNGQVILDDMTGRYGPNYDLPL